MSYISTHERPIEVSIVLRTYNEESYLPELLQGVLDQDAQRSGVEVVLVDSGSTDRTLQIAQDYGCRIVRIKKSEFTFGRSLNFGCKAARGKYLVFVSGHCVPVNSTWLSSLIQPLRESQVDYSYGRQLGRDTTKFSERQVFSKYFPSVSQVPQSGFFCNNANAALTKSAWEEFGFDEELTGLEDMMLAKRICESGGGIGYVAEAAVYHIHDETWKQVRTRYEREAIALRAIMPEVQLSLLDCQRYFVTGVLHDCGVACREGVLHSKLGEILKFRLMQFWGAYRGNRAHRVLSASRREEYFYPARIQGVVDDAQHCRSAATESEQRACAQKKL